MCCHVISYVAPVEQHLLLAWLSATNTGGPNSAPELTNNVNTLAVAPNSLQERGSGRGGFGHGGGGGWGGGGSYGPSSSYYGSGSASSRFDFGSMWAGGARKLKAAAGD
jgi:hypothetical protein